MNLIITNNLNLPVTPKRNLSIIKNIIETPYERVLFIIQETLNSLNLSSKIQSKLFNDLQWALKIIKSRMLYSYEIKEKDYVAEMSRNDPDFKQFVDFVRQYNEQMIEMKKKNNYINNELLQKPSFKLKRQMNNNQKIYLSNKRLDYRDIETKKKIIINCMNKEGNDLPRNKTPKVTGKNDSNEKNNNHVNTGSMPLDKNINFFESPLIINNKKRMNNLKFSVNNNIGLFNNYESYSVNRFKKNSRYNHINSLNLLGRINSNLSNDSNNSSINYINKANRFLNLNGETKLIQNHKMFKKTSKSYMQKIKMSERENFEYETLNKNSSIYIDHLLKIYNYDPKQITNIEFNIFELKKIVGQNNVLPLMGGVILETFGLKNDKIIKVNKLEAFLNSVSSQYLPTTLYHNNMHGADVCQSICLYFLNSKAEKIFQTTVLDLLSILISSLGHDLGHPGLNNNFHINARTELALTYNDASCLENFHCSKLFNILKKDETNIFEVLSVNEFKDIRKRMISEILATDMFFHKKIISTTQSKVPQIKPDKFEFISQDKESIKAEQQCLLDYFIHAADLGHNSKLFRISIKWVELLSEEFWLQGDKEKSLGISVSFLCDREDTNVPKGQVNFLKGFILPTFDLMTSMFPGLHFTVDNVLNNIKEWQKLVDENRQRGWTPKKINKEDEKDLNKSNNKTYKLGGGFGNKLPNDLKNNALRKISQ